MNLFINVSIGRWTALINNNIGGILSFGDSVYAIRAPEWGNEAIYSAQMVKGGVVFTLTKFGEEMFDEHGPDFEDAGLDELKDYLFIQLTSLSKHFAGVVFPLVIDNISVNELGVVTVVNVSGDLVPMGRILRFMHEGPVKGDMMMKFSSEFTKTHGIQSSTLTSTAEATRIMNNWAKAGQI